MSDVERELRNMIEEARKNNMVIFCRYAQQWWTPDEFEKTINDRRFLWGRVNFELRSPRERAKDLLREVRDARDDYENWCKRNNIEI